MTKKQTSIVRRKKQYGNMFVEMSLVMLVLIFSICGLLELARAMWTYHTLVTATDKAVRFAIVHGARCADASTNCPVTVATLVSTFLSAGVGLDSSLVDVTLTTNGSSRTCNPISSCLADSSQWPDTSSNAVGLPVTVSSTYPLQLVLKEFWPGQSSSGGLFTFAAKSTETIQF